MLMRYSKVSKSGMFTQRGNPKIAYAGMLETRLFISCVFPRQLARVSRILNKSNWTLFLQIPLTYLLSSDFIIKKAIAIGVKYSLFRRQFKNQEGVER